MRWSDRLACNRDRFSVSRFSRTLPDPFLHLPQSEAPPPPSLGRADELDNMQAFFQRMQQVWGYYTGYQGYHTG